MDVCGENPESCGQDEPTELKDNTISHGGSVRVKGIEEEKISDKPEHSGPAEEADRNDVFSYVKRSEFTSELFKIEVRGLPKFVGYVNFKQLLKGLSLDPVKIKVIGNRNPSVIYVTFHNEDARTIAIEKLDNYQWKGKHLQVKKANPIADPLIGKRKLNEQETGSERRLKIDSETNQNLDEAINNQVAPLWKMPYNDQLKTKDKKVNHFLNKLLKEILKIDRNLAKISPKLFEWAKTMKHNNNGLCCSLEEIRKSPVEIGYRNKCEFNVGVDKTLGFRLGLYRAGNMQVVRPPDDCPIISSQMKQVFDVVQKFLNESSLSGFNPEDHSGHWKQVTVRIGESQTMVILVIHPQNLLPEEIEKEKEQIIKFFNNASIVNSVYVHISDKRNDMSLLNLEHLLGEKFIFERIMETKLFCRISPFAFFQVNTRAAEICYKTISELANLTRKTIVFDICCGTGTIGLYLAKNVKRVIGIELNEEAIEDARENAKLNDISNAEFYQGKVEDVLKDKLNLILDQESSENIDIVAIVDPPRPGLHKSVTQALRSVNNLNRIVYVSCEPEMAQRNLIELSRPSSQTYRGDPFVPVKAVPIDMFPHTNHFELVILYQRLT